MEVPPMAFIQVEDLAPGDRLNVKVHLSDFTLHRVTGVKDPLFERAYAELCREFVEGVAMESREVLAKRFETHTSEEIDGHATSYEMWVVLKQGEIAGIVDQSPIVRDGRAVVHLSHILVLPEWRRSGLSGWLRALPVVAGRQALEKAGYPPFGAVTVTGEMEHPSPESLPALTAFERAGFLKPDPALAPYYQPDFRSAAEIDSTGIVLPRPYVLVIRRVAREEEQAISGRELREIVHSLYFMYGRTFRPQDMQACWDLLERFPVDEELVPLIPPTQVTRSQALV